MKKIGGQWIFGGASDFSNLLAPWASDSRSLMLRAVSLSANDSHCVIIYVFSKGPVVEFVSKQVV